METPSVPPSDAMRFRVRLRTRWSDEDNHSVLNNAVFLTLLEEARFAYFTQAGLLEANRFPFVLAQCHAVYLAPGKGGCEVEVELATTHVGTTSFTQAYRVRDAGSGAVWCEAEARLVCTDLRTGEKVPISAKLRESFARIEA